MKRQRFGFPPDYRIHMTGLLHRNHDSSRTRDVPFFFHTDPMCASMFTGGESPNVTVTEVTIFENLADTQLFLVKEIDGKYIPMTHCGMCLWSNFRLITSPGKWANQGSCLDHDVNLWFPSNEGRRPSYDLARRICDDCPVKQDCLNYAIETKQLYGMWGGTTPTQRRGMYLGRDSEDQD